MTLSQVGCIVAGVLALYVEQLIAVVTEYRYDNVQRERRSHHTEGESAASADPLSAVAEHRTQSTVISYRNG